MATVSRPRIFGWLSSRIFLAIVAVIFFKDEIFDSTKIYSINNHTYLRPEISGNQNSLESGHLDLLSRLLMLPSDLLESLPSLTISDKGSVISHTTIALTLIILEYFYFKTQDIFKKETQSSWAWFTILSPISIYLFGLQSALWILPALLFLLGSTYFLKGDWFLSGVLFGLAISTQLNLFLVLPFFIIYFFGKKKQFWRTKYFILGFIPGIANTMISIIYLETYRNQLVAAITKFSFLNFSSNLRVSEFYLFPIAYVIVILYFFRLVQISSFVLISFCNATLMVYALSQSDNSGYYYWALLFIVTATRAASIRAQCILWLWQLVVCFLLLQLNTQTSFGKFLYDTNFIGIPIQQFDVYSYINFLIGVALIFKVIGDTLISGDIYRLAKLPLSVLIAGDSGVGKDTLSNELASFFGDHEVSLLLGDDYHLYERGDPAWLRMSHLAIQANDIERLGNDFDKLLQRKKVLVKHYDHSVGRFTLPRKITPSQLVIVNGLHSLLIRDSAKADLRLFLSMDNDLRIQFKIERDMHERSYADRNEIREKIASRMDDYEKYVLPQLSVADLHFRITSLGSYNQRLLLTVASADATFLEDLRNAVCSLTTCSMTITQDSQYSSLEIDTGEFRGEDGTTILNRYLRSSDQIFLTPRKLSDGSIGLMTTISILALMRKRLQNVNNS